MSDLAADIIFVGPGMWNTPISEVTSMLPKSLDEMPVSHAIIWWIGILFLFTHAPAW